MPAALLRPCSQPGGCPELVVSGRCKAHTQQVERFRGSAHARGYGSAWFIFRERFKGMLVRAGIAPACGASLPGGPDTKHWSSCAAEGRLNGSRLHLDHEPPLTAAEREAARRGDRRAVDSPLRVGFLCEADHARKTLAQTGASR